MRRAAWIVLGVVTALGFAACLSVAPTPPRGCKFHDCGGGSSESGSAGAGGAGGGASTTGAAGAGGGGNN